MQEHLNASRTPEFLSKGDLVHAHKPDAKRGKFAHTLRGPYMIVGCHSGNNNYTLQTFIDQNVQQPTRNINDLRPFLDTDDSDKIYTSDALPFTQLLSFLIPTSGGDTTTARKSRENSCEDGWNACAMTLVLMSKIRFGTSAAMLRRCERNNPWLALPITLISLILIILVDAIACLVPSEPISFPATRYLTINDL
jgi:hypothetical protein